MASYREKKKKFSGEEYEKSQLQVSLVILRECPQNIRQMLKPQITRDYCFCILVVFFLNPQMIEGKFGPKSLRAKGGGGTMVPFLPRFFVQYLDKFPKKFQITKN